MSVSKSVVRDLMGWFDDDDLEDVGGNDTPGGPQTTDVLSIGGQVVGTAAGEDHDWYRVTLTAGTFYSFAASSAEGDLLLTIRDADGSVLRFDDDSGAGLNALLTFEAGRSGDYYVDVRNLTDERASYSLSAVTTTNPFPADPITASPSTTGVISVAGGAVDGLTDGPGDADWRQIGLTAGVHYRFDMTPSGADPHEDPFLRLYDSAGVLVAADDDSGAGRGATLWFTPTASGLYYISAEAYADETGTYRLTASQGAAQNPLDTIDLGTRVGSGAAFISIYFASAGETYNDFTASRGWTDAEKAAAMAALATFGDYANITYSVASSPTSAIRLVLDNTLEAAGLMATDTGVGSAAVFNPDSGAFTDAGLLPGGQGFETLMHEFAHGLGLAHPHDPGGTSQVMEGVTSEFDSYGASGLNQTVYTIMSYNAGWPGGDSFPLTGYSEGAASTPMALDIAVLQRKYGAIGHNFDHTTYLLGGEMDHQYRAIWDTGGNDTISAASTAHAVRIDLRPATLLGEAGGGGYLSGWIPQMGGGYTIANGVEIENAVGSAYNDILTGSAIANVLEGGGGDDAIDGGDGLDTASYASSGQGVTVSLSLAGAQATGQGADTLTSIENLTGSAHADQLTGGASVNRLSGGAGDDVLIAGDGADYLYGEAGSDVLYGQAGGDTLNDGGETTNRDFLYGGAGSDNYYVTSSLTGPTDLVFEGGDNPDLMAGADDYDIIYSFGEFFWDYYGVAESIHIQRYEGVTQVVGGTNSQLILGNAGTDLISAYGGSNTVLAGPGIDAVSFGLYGLDESYDGVNTLWMRPGSGIDYVYEFESGVDKIDLRDFHFGITGQQVLDQAVNVDQAGMAGDYCYFYLTGAGGVDNYVAFIGLLSNQLQAADFLT